VPHRGATVIVVEQKVLRGELRRFANRDDFQPILSYISGKGVDEYAFLNVPDRDATVIAVEENRSVLTPDDDLQIICDLTGCAGVSCRVFSD
jgi:hypothetical protein